jgi:spermidine synthase
MTRAASPARAPAHTQATPLPPVVLLFAGSGCAALIYQIVWLQLLQLVIGSSAVSLGVLLGTFMGGMCLGSWLFPITIDARYRPLKVFACLELGVGLMGIVILHAMPLINTLYVGTGGGISIRAIVAALCLLPPTAMMGATLPAISRWVTTTPAGVSWLGFFYGGNIFGAVAGTLLAGFYLLRVYDVAVATYVAAAINVAVALTSLRLAQRVGRLGAVDTQKGERAQHERTPRAERRATVFVVIALSGFTALASEVIWTRLLSLTVGATVFAFALILAAFLSGLGIGSSIGAAAGRRAARPNLILGWCQLLLCAALAWGAYLLTESFPYSSIAPASGTWTSVRLDFVRCLWVVLPAAILWGASFPLALAAAATPGSDPARLVGSVYAANTLGAIAGSACGVLMAANLGSRRSMQLLILTCALAALVATVPARVRQPGQARRRSREVALLAGIVLSIGLAWRVAPIPDALIAYGRNAASWMDVTSIIYAGEGLNAFVAVSRTHSGAPVYHAAGKVQASSEGEDMRLQRMLAHLSHLIPERPTNVLVIGLGAGITAGAVAIAPRVERMTVVEIERLVPSVSEYFGDYNYRVVHNPKVTVRIDDARHYLMTSRDTYDVITSDLVDPWVKGTAALFTREFFDTMKAHLAPGGVVTLFVQLYLSNPESVKSEIGTFMEVFPHTIVWGNTLEGKGYDLVLTGSVEPFVIDIDRTQALLDTLPYAQVAQSLRDIGVGSAVDLFSSYAAAGDDLRPWLRDAIINRDRNLRLQYLAGMGLDLQQSGPIYADMLRYSTFPAHLFAGSAASIRALRDGVDRASRRAVSTFQEPNR